MRLFTLEGMGLQSLSVACFVLWTGAFVHGQDARSGRIEIAVGAGHGVLLKSDGTVWTWGVNGVGQLGRDGDDSWTPSPVSGLTSVRNVAADSDFSMARKADGSVWTWGDNKNGQMGNGSKNENGSPVPAVVRGLPSIVAIAAGGNAAMALDSNGDVWGWGEGFGSKPERLHKQPPNVIAIAMGSRHLIFLDTKGQVWVSGAHGIEEIQGGSSYEPQQVPGFSDILAVAGGSNSTFGLKKDGTVWAVGSGFSWLKGRPTMVTGLSDVRAIAARGNNVVALKGDGTMWAWGENSGGALGNADVRPGVHCEAGLVRCESASRPVRVGTLTGITAIASGGDHSAAVTNQAVVWTWGRNSGALGAGPQALQQSDVPMRPGKAIPRKCVTLADMGDDNQAELFSCQTAKKKWIQICGDPVDRDDPDKKWKNLNYRIGPENGPPDLMFPARPESAPPSLFYSSEKQNDDGMEAIRFTNGAFTYRVYFGIDDRSPQTANRVGGVEVFDKNGKRLSRIACEAVGPFTFDLSRILPPDPKKSSGSR